MGWRITIRDRNKTKKLFNIFAYKPRPNRL